MWNMSIRAEYRTVNAEWKIRENFGEIKGVLVLEQ